MEEHLKDEAPTAPPRQQASIDPLRRIFVPEEKRTEKGTPVFRTLDNDLYFRAPDGSIRRVEPKVNGKKAKRARRGH